MVTVFSSDTRGLENKMITGGFNYGKKASIFKKDKKSFFL